MIPIFLLQKNQIVPFDMILSMSDTIIKPQKGLGWNGPYRSSSSNPSLPWDTLH